jgi:hypothetical protein
MPESPVPAYIASLIRHFEDLREVQEFGRPNRQQLSM